MNEEHMANVEEITHNSNYILYSHPNTRIQQIPPASVNDYPFSSHMTIVHPDHNRRLDQMKEISMKTEKLLRLTRETLLKTPKVPHTN